MSCCGGGRRSTGPVVRPSMGSPAVTASRARPTLAVFRYDGDAPITVVGPATGTKYRFAAKGAEVAVDMQDRYAVKKVPRLTEVRLV